MRVLTGAAAGQIRMIHGNTVDTVVPQKNFSVDPGIGATFDIVRPATTIAASVASGIWYVNHVRAYIQRLYFSGSKTAIYGQDGGMIGVQVIAMDSTSSTPLVCWQGCETIATSSSGFYNPTPGAIAWDQSIPVGVSVRSSGKKVRIDGASWVTISGLISTALQVTGSAIAQVSGGFRSAGSCVFRSCSDINSGYLFANASGYATTKFTNSAGPGCLFDGSVLSVKDATFYGSSGHGIELKGGVLSIVGAVSGTGNTGAGVYAHSGSVVHIKHGTPPTLTGTVGDFSTDGTTAATTWAAVDGGTPYTDASELTMVKEVP